jgi:hypothetical protein
VNQKLLTLLQANIHMTLTTELLAQIFELANRVPELVPLSKIAKIEPEQYGDYTFACERLEHILEEVKPLHLSHWNEKEIEEGRPQFNPDYLTFIRFERAGRAVVFTLRERGRLIGNFSLYIAQSMHTQALRSTEDTLYILPECRKGRLAGRLVAYGERGLKQLGVTEISVTVKIANKHGRYFQMLGYQHVSNGLMKVLEN